MTRAEANGGRFLLLITPQLLASAVAIAVFIVKFNLPVDLVRLHLVTIGAAECVFFLVCGWLARWAPIARNRIAPYAYVIALFGLFLALDLLYIVSFGTHLAWGDNLSPANLRVALPHLEGFRQAYGLWVYGVAGAFLLLLLGGLATLLRFARRLFGALRAAAPAGRIPWLPLVFTILLSVIAVESWTRARDRTGLARADPIVSFWWHHHLVAPPVLADSDVQKDFPPDLRFHRRNVIVVTIDSVRADHLSLYGYPRETMPFISDLAKAGRLVRIPFAVSVGNETQLGISAVLSSRHVEGQNPANVKIYDVLKQLGYRTYMIAAGDITTVGSMHVSYGKNLDVFADGLTKGSFSVNDDRGILEKLEQVGPFDGTPAFFYFHLMSAHSLAVQDPQFADWLRTKRHQAGDSEGPFSGPTADYDNGLRQADDFVRRIFATLERKGYLSDYTGVISSDHGEGMGEHDDWGHTRLLFWEHVDIPILFVSSDAPPGRSAVFASQIDIAPTLLHELGLPSPAAWEGFALDIAPPRRDVFLTSKRLPGWRGVIRVEKNHIYKYLFSDAASDGHPERLFDIKTDPHEQIDLIDSAPPALLDDLRVAAFSHFQIPIPVSPKPHARD